MRKMGGQQPENTSLPAKKPAADKPVLPETAPKPAKEYAQEFGGPTGPEPTRYGDWERNGKVSDF